MNWGSVEKLVKEHVTSKMPARIKKLVSGARTDLYGGPYSKTDMRAFGVSRWPGYSKAIDEISDWASDHVSELWVDTGAGFVMDSEPEGFTDEDTGEYVEPFWEEIAHFDRRDVMRAVFDVLVTDGGLQ